MNWGPLSDAMSSGSPKLRKTELKRCSAISMAVGKPLRGMSLQAFENRSTATNIHVLPSDGGKSVTKSTPRCDQGRRGMGRGGSFPDGRCRGVLDMAHSGHPLTYLPSHPGPPEAIFKQREGLIGPRVTSAQRCIRVMD